MKISLNFNVVQVPVSRVNTCTQINFATIFSNYTYFFFVFREKNNGVPEKREQGQYNTAVHKRRTTRSNFVVINSKLYHTHLRCLTFPTRPTGFGAIIHHCVDAWGSHYVNSIFYLSGLLESDRLRSHTVFTSFK